MAEAYIIDALRTPTGRRGGGLSQIHPADLGGHVLDIRPGSVTLPDGAGLVVPPVPARLEAYEEPH